MSGKKCNVSTVSWQKSYARTFYLKDPIVRKRVGTPDYPTIEEGSEHHAMWTERQIRRENFVTCRLLWSKSESKYCVVKLYAFFQ